MFLYSRKVLTINRKRITRLPNAELKALQDSNNLTKLMAVQEEVKTYPFGDVWDYFCEVSGAPVGMKWFEEVEDYEKEVLSKRN